MSTKDDNELHQGSLDAIRSESLESAYVPHDSAQAYVVALFEAAGFEVVQHGTDNRHADVPQYGDGPDLAIVEDGSVVCYIEVKSKRLSSDGDWWYGGLNLRHLREYRDHAIETELPVFVFACVIDEDKGLILRHGFYHVTETTTTDRVVESQGNDVVWFDNDDERSFDYVVNMIQETNE